MVDNAYTEITQQYDAPHVQSRVAALLSKVLPLPEKDVAALCCRTLRRGEYLFYGGERCNAVYVVRCGALKLSCISSDGHEQIIGFPMPGDVVGLEAMADGQHQSFARALETTSVFVVPTEMLARATDGNAELQMTIVRQMAKLLVHHEEMLQTVGRRTAEQRIAFFLLRYADHLGELGFSATEFNLPMTRRDIAAHLALAVETVSRVLKRLEVSGIIAIDRHLVVIRDRDALGEMSEDFADVADACAAAV